MITLEFSTKPLYARAEVFYSHVAERPTCPFTKAYQLQSDQYPNVRPDEIVLSFRDPAAIEALHVFADLTDDDDIAVAIVKRLDAIAEEYVQMMSWLDE